MFKIIKNPEFTAAVKVTIPVEGGFADASFTARFRALSVSETDAFNLFTAEGTSDYLRTIFVGWEDVCDDAGQPMSFNNAARDELIDLPYVRSALVTAYNAAMSGAKRGN